MNRILGFLFFTLLLTPRLFADEGMWIPLLIEKYNLVDMKEKGFKLTAEDIYSINQPSLKDAIVMFGRGCTGELISPNGLLITNHHCGYGVIQRHSSIENDYLTNGFWAMTMEEELPSPGLTVTFLNRIEDVTDQVLEGVTSDMEEVIREALVQSNSKAIADSAISSTNFTARVVPFYYGNQYFLFVYEVFSDVRLVGAPPSDIGKFGGDTDNWMWPRHTGDFALFRIYADKDNKPASYSPENVPYKPKRFLPISTKGVQQGDFTMVYGYPARTEQYITSQAVNQVANVSNPLKISLRQTRLNIMDHYMRDNDTVRIKYASKHAGVANAWKKWIGERNGLIRLNAIVKKEELEQQFAEWVKQSPKRVQEYGDLLSRFNDLYQQREQFLRADDLRREAISAIEINRFAQQFTRLINEFYTGSEPDLAAIESLRNSLIQETRRFYKDYHMPIDREIFYAFMRVFNEKIHDDLKPPMLNQLIKQFNGDWNMITAKYFNESIFVDSTKLIYYLTNFNKEAADIFKNDIVYAINFQFDSIFAENVILPYEHINNELNILYRTYFKGLMEMQPDGVFYPDANFTLRVSYGNVDGYSPSDAIDYLHFTTIDGIAEKSNMDVYDYSVPQKLLDIYEAKDYGRWEVNGTVPVAFIATNHTSGGNSGSPVINDEGHLIGVNFDRVWEGTMSDIMFDPDMCRNISLDIRYALFIIEKFAGANHLLEEMTLID
jgi:hypothetical protein